MPAAYNEYYSRVNDTVIEYGEFRRPFEHRIIIKALALNPNDVLLEIGCNKGRFLATLAKHGGLLSENVYGIDVNEHGIAYAQKHVAGRFSVMDATKLAFKTSMFDKILMMHVLEHIPDYKKTLSEIRRVLKPDGTAIITVPLDLFRPHFFRLAGTICRAFGLHKKQLDTRKFWHQVAHYLMNNPHVHIFRIRQLLSDFQEAGFSTISVRPVCYIPIIPLPKPVPAQVRSIPCVHDLLSYRATLVLKKKIEKNLAAGS